MADDRRILLCRCDHSHVAEAQTVSAVLARLGAAGARVDVVADLCGLAARRDGLLKELSQAGELAVVACYPRAVKWLFEAAGAPLEAQRVRFFNMRIAPAGQIARSLLGPEAPDAPAIDGESPAPPAEAQWVPWFPVIDYDRCKHCRQCLDFCLFGVYGVSEDGRVEASHPTRCKTNCPACARVCPEVAIIFPKHRSSPVNGDTVRPAHERREPVAVNLSALAGGDVHAALRSRSGKGAAVAALQDELGIPPEVVRDLTGTARSACACDCDCAVDDEDDPGQEESA